LIAATTAHLPVSGDLINTGVFIQRVIGLNQALKAGLKRFWLKCRKQAPKGACNGMPLESFKCFINQVWLLSAQTPIACGPSAPAMTATIQMVSTSLNA
jgi:hypothetical protein